MTSDGASGLDLDLGFTLGLGMAFEPTVEWAAGEGFSFVELLLDGPYARERIADRVREMRASLEAAGVGMVVHLPFAADPGSPFRPVRAGAVEEYTAGMDLTADLGAETVVFHPSSGAWDRGWTDAERRGFVHEALDELVPAATQRGLEPCLENVVSSYYVASAFPELLERYPNASMTFDTSHALLSGMGEAAMAAFCRTHADRIGHLHLVDPAAATTSTCRSGWVASTSGPSSGASPTPAGRGPGLSKSAQRTATPSRSAVDTSRRCSRINSGYCKSLPDRPHAVVRSHR